MNSFFIEKFYLFFQGILVFESFFIGTLFYVTKKKDMFFYSLYLLIQTIYFFWNAPHTFFNLDDNTIFNSSLYLFVNTPLIILSNLAYIFFLKEFFFYVPINKNFKKLIKIFLFIGLFFIAISVFLIYKKIDQQFIFYFVNFLSSALGIIILINIRNQKTPYVNWVITGIVLNIFGNALTILMIVLWRSNIHHLFTDEYPLFFMRCGILADIFLYQMAILKKWNFQEKQLLKQSVEEQLSLQRLRNQISGELHDDIGSTLSGLSMYSHLTKNQMANGEYDHAKASLKIIQKSADEMVDKLGDLVWSVNPKQDSLDLLFERLEQFAIQMCAAKNIKFLLIIPKNIAEIVIGQEHRHHLYLIVKEAINNAVKYSEATLLQLIVNETNHLLNISIIDNGKGCVTPTLRRGNGLNNIQKRADELGADFSIKSKAEEGCNISLKLQIPQ